MLKSSQLDNPKSLFCDKIQVAVCPTADVSAPLPPQVRESILEHKPLQMPPCEDTLSPNIQRATQAARDAPGNSWVTPTKLCVFPGCLPLPGSKKLCLSQSCSLIYPLALCFSLPLSLPHSLTHSLPLHLSDRFLHLSLSLMLSFILLTHSSNQHFPPSDLLKWTNGH